LSALDRVSPPAGTLRAALALAVIVPFTLVGLPLQWLLWRLRLPGRRHLPMLFHRVVLRALGIRLRVSGGPTATRPVLLIANHVSWIDIPVLGSLFPLCFVAKSDIAGWPVAGLMARMQRSVFVDRSRRTLTGDVAAEMAERMADGDPVVLFAEGTTGDGNRLLPFRSALIGGARDALGPDGAGLMLQPVGIAYTRRDGLPIGRTGRALIAWYGDMELLPHLLGILRGGPIDVAVTFGDPVPLESKNGRKGSASRLEGDVRRMVREALNGRAGVTAQAAPAVSAGPESG
jgi:1-acyl-sn-glycerol-3-phosphate acyltransferase